VRLVCVRKVGNAARSLTTVEDATQIELLQTGFGTKVGGNKRSTRTVDQRDGREAKGSG
ncbi:unnamed protein product, partial [Porites lobata]